MKSLLIEGPSKISGTIIPGGNKNAALPIISACLLTRDEVVIHNMPDILDVQVMLDLISGVGVQVERNGTTVKIRAEKILSSELSPKLCAKVRGSILFAGSLTYRCGEAHIGLPGGDFIGRRRLDSHYYGLGNLGISHRNENGIAHFVMKNGKMNASDLFLDEASVTATEQLLIAAVVAEGTTYIRNAAGEPHVQQLGELLNAMGAKIKGLGTNTLTIHGVSELHGAEYTIESDHVEVASYLALAAATGGGIEIKGNFRTAHYWMTRRVFERFGIKFTLKPNHIILPPGQELKVKMDSGDAIPTVADGPWPQFPSDMMSCMIVAATQAQGTVLFFEKMFESRMYFVDRLISMGAKAIVCDPHRAVIMGPCKLVGLEMSSPDIRAGMALVLAAACAEGKSVIHNADTIYRGYENLVPKLQSIGVNVVEQIS